MPIKFPALKFASIIHAPNKINAKINAELFQRIPKV